MSVDIVIPTQGRVSLRRLLASIEREGGPPGRVLVVDDRRRPTCRLEAPEWAEVLRGRGAGPAAARNRGWRSSLAEWVAFLDDDTELTAGWIDCLAEDLRLSANVAASQGTLVVPRPVGRRPTDAERAVIGLETARYATADMAYRRDVLAAVGGFDERFPRAYREDSDLALRVLATGREIVRGARRTLHPLGADGLLGPIRRQAGNRDDVLMRALHGRGWRERAGAPRGRLRRHAAITAAGLAALAAGVSGRRRAAAAAASWWLAGTGELAWARVAPGPRTPAELARIVASSVAIPPLATGQAAAGLAELARRMSGGRPEAVLLDRDGTLVEDVPYNGDPGRVRPIPGAARALDGLRRAGVRLAVVTNQSGIARGLITGEQVRAVNRRVEELLGPLGPWFVCPHDDSDGCACRKPAAGMLVTATRELRADPSRSAMIGDTGADMEAARAAGVRGVMVPTPATLPHEVAEAADVAPDLGAAVDILLGVEG